MDELEREIRSSLLPWLEQAKGGAIDEPPDLIQELVFGEQPHVEQAHALIALADKYPQEHVRLSQNPRYLDGVELARQIVRVTTA